MNGEVFARTVGFQAGERNVFLHLLTVCNLSCRHCYINPGQHGTATLDKDTAIQWLGLFARPQQRSNLVLLGGEPTLHADLPLLIQTAKDLRYSVTVDTNGYLFHDFLERVDPTRLDFLSFSLDGPDPEVNDPIRGEGVFAVCTSNIRRAVAAGFRVSLICTVSSLNIDHLARMPALLTDLGVRRFFIQVIGLRGNPASCDAGAGMQWQVDPQRWLALVPEVAKEAARRGIHVVYPKVYLDPGETFLCAGLVAENFFIFPNGRVYQCPLCEDYPIHSYQIENNQLIQRQGLNEDRFFPLQIPEGCVMNRLLQPENIAYQPDGSPLHRISCCLLKQEIVGCQSGE